MRILGIDYGDARVGVAICDPLGLTAQALETIHSRKAEKVIDRLVEIIEEYKVEKIVIGMPKNMDGTIGFRGEKTKEFVDEFKKVTDLQIIFWDERLSTVSAKRVLNETNTRGRKRKNAIDSLAASYILQNYLDSIR